MNSFRLTIFKLTLNQFELVDARDQTVSLLYGISANYFALAKFCAIISKPIIHAMAIDIKYIYGDCGTSRLCAISLCYGDVCNAGFDRYVEQLFLFCNRNSPVYQKWNDEIGTQVWNVNYFFDQTSAAHTKVLDKQIKIVKFIDSLNGKWREREKKKPTMSRHEWQSVWWMKREVKKKSAIFEKRIFPWKYSFGKTKETEERKENFYRDLLYAEDRN